MSRRARFFVPSMIAVALIAAACGDDSTSSTPAGVGSDAWIAVASTDLGEILVAGDGLTLYGFTVDTDGTSACFEECAAAWPPLPYEDDAVGDGVDASLLGSTERDDGLVQAVYAGQPLYTFAGDASPGDTTGQGVNDVWYVVDPAGAMIAVSSAEPAPEDPTEAGADPFGY